MKQLSKMMLAAVASVALATSAYAWDFSASGSSTATFKQKTVTPATGDATVDTNFTSSGGGVTVSSSNSDGANSATFSYTADWNGDAGNFDESVSVSGSKKVGNWTASSATTQHMQKDVGPTEDAKPMRANNSAVITLTDGSMTYKLGNAAHLSTAEKTSGGPMGGAQDAEARLDAFDGFSVGMGVGPGTLTVALEMRSADTSVFFGEDQDATGATADTATACGSDSTNFGFNFAGDVGADLTFTYASGSSSAQADSCTGDNSSNVSSMNTMGLGVGVPVGGMTIALDYEATTHAYTAATVENSTAKSGFEISVVMPVGDATAGVNISSTSSTVTTAGTAGDAAVTAGTELWYTVPIGAASLSAGYGSAAVKDGSTTTEIGAEMTMSF
ncbi:hypothetical protein OAJ98_04400 [Deltaproteobacteria bacterium]|nr:hypothetical protein [Deltaproteobacteria bacterium]